MVLATFLLLSGIAHAEIGDEVFTAAELAHRKAVLTKAFAAAHAAEDDPPLAYLDELSSAMFLGAPPAAACPLAAKNYAQLEAFDLHLRLACRDFASWSNEKLHGPTFPKSLVEEIRRQRESAQGNELQADGSYDTSFRFGPEIDHETPRGEEARMECALPMILLMQYRKWSLQHMQKIFQEAELVVDGEKSPDDYFRYLDRGERSRGEPEISQ